MRIICPNTHSTPEASSGFQNTIIYRRGSFYRKSDRKRVQRFCCSACKRNFSIATLSINYRQKKRQLNREIERLLVAGVSQRELARIYKINRKTVVRKMIFRGMLAEEELKRFNQQRPSTTHMQFDDMETFEHTKLKPLSITLAVEEKTRRILGFKIARMPAKGLLAAISRKKYGRRKDERSKARAQLFTEIKPFTTAVNSIKSDENPHYPRDVKRFYPNAEHKVYKGRKGALVGQGELKKIKFDPIFDLNHTCATLRARTNRLFRRTWCTTKKPERLKLHLNLVVLHHNRNLKLKPHLHNLRGQFLVSKLFSRYTMNFVDQEMNIHGL